MKGRKLLEDVNAIQDVARPTANRHHRRIRGPLTPQFSTLIGSGLHEADAGGQHGIGHMPAFGSLDGVDRDDDGRQRENPR